MTKMKKLALIVAGVVSAASITAVTVFAQGQKESLYDESFYDKWGYPLARLGETAVIDYEHLERYNTDENGYYIFMKDIEYYLDGSYSVCTATCSALDESE